MIATTFTLVAVFLPTAFMAGILALTAAAAIVFYIPANAMNGSSVTR